MKMVNILLFAIVIVYNNLQHMVQAIYQLLLKRLMPASSGIADGRLREMYSQQRHATRRY